MSLAGAADRPTERPLRSWLPFFLLLGLYVSLRGYHSFDGDQAYRLPLLLHRQDPGLYADDPFVRSFDVFNPHRGSLALLDAVSRTIGLSSGLFVIFATTFVATARAVVRLTQATWPEMGPSVGWVAVCLFLAAKAGNIGTNHLFEAMVLDRLVALALGWLAIADAVTRPSAGWWRSAIWISMATVVHPSVGLQLALVLASGWIVWSLTRRVSLVKPRIALLAVSSLAIAVAPGLAINLPRGSRLAGDLPASVFRILSVELQNPQHMLPHLWRMPQWLAWFSYLALAIVHLASQPWRRTSRSDELAPDPESTASRTRLVILVAALASGLAAAWYAIEVEQSIQATVFQPFRMGTVARGIALVLISGRLASLWRTKGVLGRTRASVLITGLLGDWLLVVTTLGELAASSIEAISRAMKPGWIPRIASTFVYFLVIAMGLNFLAHHDTESGHIPLLIALALGLAMSVGGRTRHFAASLVARQDDRRTRRFALAVGLCWIVPCAALLAAMIPPHHRASHLPLVRSLVDRCRFVPIPLDDIERLALWCREETPVSSRFIGPPGPKTFRLWSRRNLAFSRSGSPYHGAGLADWFARFQDHVDYRGTPEDFVRAYRDHRHEFEARYDALSDAQRASLAVRQGAQYVIAEVPKDDRRGQSSGPLELLHVEGRYAVYRVNPSALVHRQP